MAHHAITSQHAQTKICWHVYPATTENSKSLPLLPHTQLDLCIEARNHWGHILRYILSSQGLSGAWVERIEEALDELASVASETELLLCVSPYGGEPVEPGFDVIASTNLGCEFAKGVFDSSILFGNRRSLLSFASWLMLCSASWASCWWNVLVARCFFTHWIFVSMYGSACCSVHASFSATWAIFAIGLPCSFDFSKQVLCSLYVLFHFFVSFKISFAFSRRGLSFWTNTDTISSYIL